jgi:hypothetical protein
VPCFTGAVLHRRRASPAPCFADTVSQFSSSSVRASSFLWSTKANRCSLDEEDYSEQVFVCPEEKTSEEIGVDMSQLMVS